MGMRNGMSRGKKKKNEFQLVVSLKGTPWFIPFLIPYSRASHSKLQVGCQSCGLEFQPRTATEKGWQRVRQVSSAAGASRIPLFCKDKYELILALFLCLNAGRPVQWDKLGHAKLKSLSM